MSKHTKGPWDFDQDDLGLWVNSPKHPAPIAKMGKTTAFDQIANARLIAAAPELLEALEDLAEMAAYAMNQANCDGAEWDIKDCLSDARAAIAKAKGESQ